MNTGTGGRFHQRGLADRLGGLAGRPAEQAFLRWLEHAKGYQLGSRVWRYGLDQLETRGNNNAVATLGGFILHSPDFASVGGHLWEVQGTSDEVFQFKKEKLDALTLWAAMQTGKRQLRWFLYRSQDDTAVLATHETVLWAVGQPESTWHEDLFDGKAGWTVPVSVFAACQVAGDPFLVEQRAAEAGGGS